MKIRFSSNRPDLINTVGDVVRIFIPDVRFVNDEEEMVLNVDFFPGKKISVRAGLVPAEENFQIMVEEAWTGGEKRENQLRRVGRLAVYRLLQDHTKDPGSPWGVLTGIRPVKIVHRWIDEGKKDPEIEHNLKVRYLMAASKARLLLDVVRVQRPILGKTKPKTVSIYIGIPFCPTRCIYCSFFTEPLATGKRLIPPFLKALFQEMESLAIALNKLGLVADTVYLGGGTPTSLSDEDFEQLLRRISSCFYRDHWREFTVEAGRPDTLNDSKFKAMKKWGVTRVSINPQSMHQETLDLIGRHHTVEQVVEKQLTAAAFGFVTNMDLILGLPGETPFHVKETLNQIAKLDPDNVTIHTLALKRTSWINKKRDMYYLPSRPEVEEMMTMAGNWAGTMGLYPYYLYRQKNMLGQMENIGYCKPQKECFYNISIIEERQMVLGLGVGAGSKFVDAGGSLVSVFYNPKDIPYYSERLDSIIQKKIDKLKSIG